MFEILNQEFSMWEIYKFITFLNIEMLLFSKQCPLSFSSLIIYVDQQRLGQNCCLI